jgi:chromate transporter
MLGKQKKISATQSRDQRRAVVWVLWAALYTPIWPSAVGNGRDVAIALVGFLLLERWRVSPLAIVIFCVGAALTSVAIR